MGEPTIPKLLVPKYDVALSLCGNIDNICKPLHKFGINFFNYLRIYADGSIVDLNNHPDLTEFFYYKSNWYQSFSPIINSMAFEPGFILDSTLSDQNYFNDTKERFDVDHVVFFITRDNDSTTFWQFGTFAGNNKILNFYVNNADLLKAFTTYFSNEGKKLINLAEENKYKIITQVNKDQHSSLCAINSFDAKEIETAIKRFNYVDSRYSLTSREAECLKLYSEGMSADEISAILKISRRTVESHVANMKMKLNCKNTVELVAKAICLGYLKKWY